MQRPNLAPLIKLAILQRNSRNRVSEQLRHRLFPLFLQFVLLTDSPVPVRRTRTRDGQVRVGVVCCTQEFDASIARSCASFVFTLEDFGTVVRGCVAQAVERFEAKVVLRETILLGQVSGNRQENK